MTPKIFRSKIDRWVLILLIGAMIVQAFALGAVAFTNAEPGITIIMIVSTLVFVALLGSLVAWTYYSIEGPVLKVVSGPFRWKVPIAEIKSVEATRNPLSSPALSLDRLRITWGEKNHKIMISPADKNGFVKALGMELSH
jgi:membrane protein YdbS with pleckstrin-like domain